MGTKRVSALAVLLVGLGLILSGCGSSNSADSTRSTQEQHAKQVAQRARQRAHLRHQARVAAKRAAARRRVREAHRAVALRRRRAEEREARQLAAAEAREQEDAETSEPTSECDPSYSGACLNPYSSDYDCEGGSGNGPDYTGEVTVVGEDHYGLDADGDGVGCEPY